MDTRTRRLIAKLPAGLLSAATLGCLLTAFSQPVMGEIIVGPAPGGLASQTAQYNQRRSIVERAARNDNGEFWVSPNIILNDGFNQFGANNGSHFGVFNAAPPSGSAAAYGAAYNRQRAILNETFLGDQPSSSSNRARANAYRKSGD
jgi:hypothetical protein